MGADGLDGEETSFGLERRHERIGDLHEVASLLLHGLDELGLYEAAAHVTLAISWIRTEHPQLINSKATPLQA
jgi:hypothetical protein